tara:strand:- start:2048 stop:2356 length:309 start_codon:yes stop_codon:yes gene_type:complete
MKDERDTALLRDPSFLMVLLAAFCRKSGGSLQFTDTDLSLVRDTDALGLYKHATRDDAFILKLVDRSEYREYLRNEDEKKNKPSKNSSKYALYDDADDEWEN